MTNAARIYPAITSKFSFFPLQQNDLPKLLFGDCLKRKMLKSIRATLFSRYKISF